MIQFKIFSFLVLSLFPCILGMYRFVDQVKRPLTVLTGVAGFYTASVPPRLALYLGGSSLLGLALLLSFFIPTREKYYNFFKNNRLGATLFLLLVLNVLIYWIPSPAVAAATVVFYGLLFANKMFVGVIPCTRTSRLQLTWPGTLAFLDRYAAKILLVFVCLSGLLLYMPKVFCVPTILNGFYRIPETYKAQDGMLLSNTDIVNAFKPVGMSKKIDVLNFQDWKGANIVVKVPENNTALQGIVSACEAANTAEAKNYWGFIKSNFYSPIVVYRDGYLFIVWADGSNQKLAKISNYILLDKLYKVIPEQAKHLREMYENYFLQDRTRFDIGLQSKIPNDTLLNILYATNFDTTQKNQNPDIFSRTASDLLKNNNFLTEYGRNSASEVYWQINSRGEIMHQMHYLIPVHEYLRGKPLGQSSHLYGLGMTLLGAYVTKIFTPAGTLDYGIFYRMLASMSCLAFAILLIGMYLIFRNYVFVSICALAWLVNQFALGFETYTLSAGVADFRTFFDVIVLCFVYFVSQEKTFLRCLGLILTLILAVFISFEFGMMITIACMGALACEMARRYDVRGSDVLSLVVLLGICTLGVLFHGIGTQGKLSQYFLSGLLSAPLRLERVLVLFVPLFLYVAMYIHMIRGKSKFSLLFILSAFYSQEILLYYVWSGMFAHFLIFSLRYTFPVFFYAAFLFLENRQKMWINRSAFAVCLVVLYSILMPYLHKFGHEYLAYHRVIDSHVMYNWKFDKANIQTTMNPKYFLEAVSIIKKYIPKNVNKIYMLSQYENFLPFLADKYSGMPYYSTIEFLITDKEKQSVYQRLVDAKPEYLFVDSDINTPYELDIVPVSEAGWRLHEESLMRVYTLNALRDLFLRVQKDYEPVDKGVLITAYRRKR